jgi:hypothetical protein
MAIAGERAGKVNGLITDTLKKWADDPHRRRGLTRNYIHIFTSTFSRLSEYNG